MFNVVDIMVVCGVVVVVVKCVVVGGGGGVRFSDGGMEFFWGDKRALGDSLVICKVWAGFVGFSIL